MNHDYSEIIPLLHHYYTMIIVQWLAVITIISHNHHPSIIPLSVLKVILCLLLLCLFFFLLSYYYYCDYYNIIIVDILVYYLGWLLYIPLIYHEYYYYYDYYYDDDDYYYYLYTIHIPLLWIPSWWNLMKHRQLEACEERLSTGARVTELQLLGERLRSWFRSLVGRRPKNETGDGKMMGESHGKAEVHMGLSENVGYVWKWNSHLIGIYRDNDHENHWV